jgi:hypothetical protein
MLFLTWYNGRPATDHVPAEHSLVARYENTVAVLYEPFSHIIDARLWWILPATFAVTVIALKLGKPAVLTFYLKWKNRAELVLLALTTASTFTVLTSIPVGYWDPNVPRRVTSALADQHKEKVASELSYAIINNGHPDRKIVSSFAGIAGLIAKLNGDPLIRSADAQTKADLTNRLIAGAAGRGSDAASADIVDKFQEHDRPSTIGTSKQTAAEARHQERIAQQLASQAQSLESQAGDTIASASTSLRIVEDAAPGMTGEIAASFAQGDPEIVKQLVEQFLSATAEKITEKLMSRYRDTIEDKIDFAAGLLNPATIGAFTRAILRVFSRPSEIAKIDSEIATEINRVRGEILRGRAAEGLKNEPRPP